MSVVTIVVVMLVLLGSALIGGVFFAFSSFIMQALAGLPAAQGMAAMRAINVTVLNPLFLGVFLGTALLSLALSVLAISGWGQPGAPYFLAGGVFYFAGTFMVTGLGNVPLNKQLAAMTTRDPAAPGIWLHYLQRWTWLNSVRTLCATACAVVLVIGLVRH